MFTLNFYKDNNEWFLKWPEELANEPLRAELQMVLGADLMLDFLSNSGTEVSLEVTDIIEEARAEDEIFKRKEGWDYMIRADYVKTYTGAYYTTGVSLNVAPYVWLCPVTTLLFGSYPKIIYYKIHKNEQEKNISA